MNVMILTWSYQINATISVKKKYLKMKQLAKNQKKLIKINMIKNYKKTKIKRYKLFILIQTTYCQAIILQDKNQAAKMKIFKI